MQPRSAPLPTREPRVLDVPGETVARFAAAVAGAITLHFGWQFWNSGNLFLYHEIAFFDLLVYTIAFMLIWLALVEAPRWRHWTSPLILAAVLLTTLIGVYVRIHSQAVYGTEDIAFQHYGATLVLRGVDPYSVSMRPAIEKFHVPSQFQTLLQNGGVVDRMSWPAGSFLMLVPFVAVGVADLRWAVLLFQLAAIGVVYFAAPVRFRPLVLLPPFGVQDLIDFTGGGVVDFIWVLPVLFMIVCRRRAVLVGICYGIACTIKQVPWFLAPFLLVYFFKDPEYRTWQERLRGPVLLALSAIGVFLVINTPFIIHDAVGWVLGTMEAAIGNLIPFGQGLSTLTQLGFPVPTDRYVLLATAIMLLLLINYIVYFDRLRNLIWFFPAFIAWFLPRSLHNYFIYWIPILTLALARDAAIVREDRGRAV